jgi:hypothetical protein
LTTASGASVVVINAATLCNIYWQVGSSATLGTTTSFAGSILAQASITLNTGASVTGRALARTGAVTLDSNAVTTACTSGTPQVCPTIALSPATLPNGVVGVAYSQAITGSGGTAPYTYSVAGGTLPAGLTMPATGVLAGTPTTAVTSPVTIRGTDVNLCPGDRAYSMIVACPVITLTPTTLPNATLGVAYSQTMAGSGGKAPYTFTVTVGTLPVGLTLTAAGVLAGTPTAAGTSTVTIRGTDANGCNGDRVYSLIVACPVITLTPTTLPDATLGVAYSQTIAGSGGKAPYTFTITTGTLPVGLTLTAEGVLAGTPTAAGTSTVTIRGTDANGCVGEQPLTLVVIPVVPTLPQALLVLLALGLTGIGYFRLRGRAKAA